LDPPFSRCHVAQLDEAYLIACIVPDYLAVAEARFSVEAELELEAVCVVHDERPLSAWIEPFRRRTMSLNEKMRMWNEKMRMWNEKMRMWNVVARKLERA
jgi:hypothetical protein